MLPYSMSRISIPAVANAVRKVRAMDIKQKEKLVDAVFLEQPNMLAAVLVLPRFGVSMAKLDFLIDLLLICFQSMKESGQAWPVISEDEQERQMQRCVATAKFSEDLSPTLQDQAVRQYIDDHPEKALLAYVQTEVVQWMARIVPEESDKFVMLAATTLVNCIAYAPMPLASSTPSRRATGKSI